MAVFYDSIEPKLVEFIERQHMFFVGTAAADGRVNISPKGLDSFRVLGPNKVAWLNGTGSGNESAAHIRQVPRMTIMFCSFEHRPWILRLYGTPTMVQPGDEQWDDLVGLFPPMLGARQVYVVDVDEAMTACGYGVPLYSFEGDRETMHLWAKKKGHDGLVRYQVEKNSSSIDGFDAGLQTEPLLGEDQAETGVAQTPSST
ncbi:pyridoxamine 5'-phosphate oxidase family protein [Propionibacteriaceae bacterium G1746]|uniref:pyridoxamine 5'-phosphate oxidase family protein n=1 Tax=Aestuariimicrobium sp. G57 TaxID=3418485 RepID=UPI003C2775D7